MIYDVLVIGSGIAGLRSAIEAKKRSSKVGIIIKGNPLLSNSSMASGGINGALGNFDDDNIESHIEATIKSGQGLCDEEATKVMCKNGVNAILELKDMGVQFDEIEGKIAQRPFGGAGKKRTCYIQDRTGAAIVQRLFQKCREAGVDILKDYFLLSILKHQDVVSGVSLIRRADSTVLAMACKSLVLAGGGFAGIYRGYSTNPQTTSGDVIVAGLKAGLELRDLEFVQFHPTGLKNGSLITEAARGEGGILINSLGKQFVNELETRDKVALAIATEIREGREVFLDLRALGEEKINSKLPSLRKLCLNSQGLDPVSELIPIKPVAHYTTGGIKCEADTSTSIKGIFCCGEVASNLAHGANRLGGNSLLDGAVFGKIAGEEASKWASKNDFSPIEYQQVAKDLNRVDYIFSDECRYNINSLRKKLGDVLYEKAGLLKNRKDLMSAYDYVGYLKKLTVGLHCINKSKEFNVELVAILEFINSLIIAEAYILASLKREESRGSHIRDDFFYKDDANFRKHIVVRLESYGLKLEFEEKSKLFKLLEKFRKLIKN